MTPEIPDGYELVKGRALDAKPKAGIHRCWQSHDRVWHDWWVQGKRSMRNIIEEQTCAYTHFIRPKAK